MAETIKIGGELESMATGKVVAAASAIKDKTRGKTQDVINTDVEDALASHTSRIDNTDAKVAINEQEIDSVRELVESQEFEQGIVQYANDVYCNVDGLVSANVQSALKEITDKTPDTGNEASSDLDFTDEEGNVIIRCKDGEFQTQQFDSKKATQAQDSEASTDLDFADEDGNIVARCKNGEIETQKFNSAKTPRQEDSDSDFDIADEQGNVAMEVKNGHLRTRKFDSRTATSVKEDGTASNVFNITDENGNIIVQFKGGHIKTSKFDSSNIKVNSGSDIIDGYTTIKSGMRLLFIGNSWSRDTVRLLWQTAHDAGVNDLIVCQAYLGGSSLYHQYIGMDDPTATYQHGSYTQYIQGTYQLWTYKEGSDGNVSLTQRPTAYSNGKCGINDGTAWGKKSVGGDWAAYTLAQILQLYDWDIITISFQGYDLLLEDDWTENDSSKSYVDILSFINRIKQELSDDCLEKVEFGITSTWSIADGVTKDVTSTKALRYCNLTAQEWHNLSQSEKNEWYHRMYEDGQKNFQRIAKRMGNLCTYIVNTAKAFNFARKSVIIGDVGFGLHKSASDTHLAEGIPKYMCACLLCYEELGVKPQDFMDDYVAGGNPDVDTDGGSESTNPTRAQCVAAQKIAWAAYCDNYVVLN